MSREVLRSHTINMTEGDPTRLLIRFSIPMLIGNIFQQVYNVVDSIVVGHVVGKEALASVGATSSVVFLFFALCNGIGSGGGIVTSQFFGTGDAKKVKQCISNTAYLMGIMSVLVGILAFILAEPLLRLLDTPVEIINDSLSYLRLQCIGIIFVALYNYSASMLRALGDSRTPLYFLIFSCILNAVLDIVFVYSFGMGVMGAGLATVISQFISGAACLIFALKTNEYFRLDKEDFRVNRSIIMRSVKIGVPLSLQFALIAISCMALQKVVNGFGDDAVAAFTATSRLEQIIHQPYQTLGTALATYTGQNFGAGKKDRVLKGFRKGMLMMTVFSLLMLPVMQFCGEAIVWIFVKDEPVIKMGAQAVRITSYFYFCLGVIYVVRGVLNGIGDAFFAFLNGLVEVVCRISIPVFLVSLPVFGLWGIWWSVGITWFISGFTAYLRYIYFRRKAWGSVKKI